VFFFTGNKLDYMALVSNFKIILCYCLFLHVAMFPLKITPQSKQISSTAHPKLITITFQQQATSTGHVPYGVINHNTKYSDSSIVYQCYCGLEEVLYSLKHLIQSIPSFSLLSFDILYSISVCLTFL